MKLLQIRNVPDDLHRKLKVRAAQDGRSMSDVALEELRQALERPTFAELQARVRSRAAVGDIEGSADAVRAERDGR